MRLNYHLRLTFALESRASLVALFPLWVPLTLAPRHHPSPLRFLPPRLKQWRL